MSKAERGTKRQCLKCGTKYYDLNKDPIVCPSCGAPFVAAMTAAEKVRSKEKPETRDKDEEEVDEVEVDAAAAEVGAEVVSLEDAAASVKYNDDDDDDEQLDQCEPGPLCLPLRHSSLL